MSFFRRKGWFILLFGIILLVVLVGYSLSDRDHLTLPEQIIKDTVGWFQKIVYTPVNYATNTISSIDDLKNTYKENKILKEKVSEYKGLVYETQELKKENKELQKTLDKSESIREYDPIQATVISRSPERWVDQMTINKGKKDGIKDNMAVMTADCLVGKILSTSQYTSTVQLLSGFDQFNRISATISTKKGKDIFGLIEGYNSDEDELTFEIIEESNQKVKKGQLVYSSGLGGMFPSGLPIGKVKEVVPDQYGLTKTALIEPAADLYDLNNVIVVDRKLEVHEEDEPTDDGED